MDHLTRSHYEMSFELSFLRRRATDFQNFFSDIMEKSHPGDFIRVRPWGKAGDRKNDGYLRSQRTLFAVYAPNELSSAECINKIREDFLGALPFWSEYFDTWTFVHNARDGLGPDVLQSLLKLEQEQHDVRLVTWGFEELRLRALQLSEFELALLLGPAPSHQGMISLGLQDLSPVLDQIAQLEPVTSADLRQVPPTKLQHNQLSRAAVDLLKAGLSRTPLVQQYFTRRPSLRDRIAESFRQEYGRLRDDALSPDEIFSGLQRFACGDHPTPARQCATLAVLAFFFEACDIFERPETPA